MSQPIVITQNLYRTTIKTDEERAYVELGSMNGFQQAIAILEEAGITIHQLQLFKRRAFSKFAERDYADVRLLGLAIKKGALSAEKIHRALQEREYLARIYGGTTCIETESLPNIDTINMYLGLTRLPNK